MVVEVAELFWKDVGVRREIERRLAELFLHPNDVKAQPVLACDLI